MNATGSVLSVRVLGLLGAALVVSGCTASDRPSSSPSASMSFEAICERPALDSCDIGAEYVCATIAQQTAEDEILDVARDLHAVAQASPSPVGVRMQRDAASAPQLDPEVSPPSAWALDVYPGALDETEATLAEMLEIARIPGALGIGTFQGWPSVTVSDAAAFGATFDEVSSRSMFREGGTYTLLSLDEHLRIVHTPAWITAEGVHAIIALAADYPLAEILLEAPEGGAQPPTLYMSRLTPEQVLEVETRLEDPGLAGAATSGTTLEFVLGSTGTDGVTYSGGQIGRTT